MGLKKYILIYLFCLSLIACNFPWQLEVQREGYRYVHGENMATDEHGKLKRPALWFPTHSMKGSVIDSFHIYGQFDSIYEKMPDGGPKMYRKIDLKNEKTWKPQPTYDQLHLVGVYSCRELDGLVTSFYFTKDKKAILRVMYSGPNLLVDVVLFTKDSTNILRKKGILLTPDTI